MQIFLWQLYLTYVRYNFHERERERDLHVYGSIVMTFRVTRGWSFLSPFIAGDLIMDAIKFHAIINNKLQYIYTLGLADR